MEEETRHQGSSMRVAAAVSGGMDSLLALALLQEQGHEVMAVHGLFLPAASPQSPAAAALAEQCRSLGIALHILDLRREFQARVTDVFAAEYRAGRTPNPCALCNPHIKFGVLWERAQELGAEGLATGHYARLNREHGYGRRTLLQRGADRGKDQSYFLSLLPATVLERICFPLGTLHKRDVPSALDRRGLTPAHPGESQEICFIPDDDYRAWLAANVPDLPGPGPMLVRTPQGERQVGQHGGLWRYTQGQRRGLGVAWSEPLYVLEKDTVRNALVLGSREEQLCLGCETGPANLFVPVQDWPAELWVQTRYRQQPGAAQVAVSSGRLVIRWQEPEERPAPGQVAAVYDAEGQVLAGAWIKRALQAGETG